MARTVTEPVCFRSRRVPNHWRDYAARRAVLVPIYGGFAARQKPGLFRLQVERRAFRLLAEWRRRVDALRVSDYTWPVRSPWPKLLSSRSHFLINCRPTFFVPTPPNFLPCCRASICPWCWGRRAALFYDRLELALFTAAAVENQPQRVDTAPSARLRARVIRFETDATMSPVPPRVAPLSCPFQLIVRETTHPISASPLCDGAAEGAAAATGSLAALLDARVRGFLDPGGSFLHGRPHEFARAREFGMRGGIEHARVDVDASDPSRWRVTYRQLFVVDSSWEPSAACRVWLDHKAFSGHWWRCDTLTRKALAARVGWLFEYTPCLLTLDDVDLVAESVACRERRRLVGTFGILHGRAPVK